MAALNNSTTFRFQRCSCMAMKMLNTAQTALCSVKCIKQYRLNIYSCARLLLEASIHICSYFTDFHSYDISLKSRKKHCRCFYTPFNVLICFQFPELCKISCTIRSEKVDGSENYVLQGCAFLVRVEIAVLVVKLRCFRLIERQLT